MQDKIRESKLVISHQNPIYKSTVSINRMLEKSLNTLERWENPLEASVADMGNILIQTGELSQIIFFLISHLSNSQQLRIELQKAILPFSQIPPKILQELDIVSREEVPSLLRTHINIILQYRFLHGIRQHLWGVDQLLTQYMIVSEGELLQITEKIRRLFENTQYRALKEQTNLDGHQFDNLLDLSPMDWIEWKLELLLFELLREKRDIEWFRQNSLISWFVEEEKVAATQIDMPQQPMGNEIAMILDTSFLNQSIFHTDLLVSALIAILSKNWFLTPNILSDMLVVASTNPDINELGWQKVIVGLTTGIEHEDPQKFRDTIATFKQRHNGL